MMIKPRAILLTLLVAWTCFALATWAQEAAPDAEPEPQRQVERWGDLVSIFSGHIHVPAEVSQRGSVICVGGSALVEGHVTQDVVAILCDLEITGSVGGAVTGVLADMELRDATVSRELISVLGALELDNTTVKRELVNILGSLDRDEVSRAIGQVVNIGFGGKWFPSVWSLIFWVRTFHKFVVFVLLVLLVLLVPERIRLMGEEAPVRYVLAFFTGLLGYLVYFVVWGLLLVTFVGIFPWALAFAVLKWMGIAAIFYAIGRRLTRAAGISPSVLGAVLLVFAIYVVLMLAPSAAGFVGLIAIGALKLIFLLLIEIPAVGLVILTRFGTRRTEGIPAAPAAPPVVTTTPPAPPQPSPDATG